MAHLGDAADVRRGSAAAGAGTSSSPVELHGIRVFLKHDDNKRRKLKYNLLAAQTRTLLTFGGAYSNHLRAVARAGRLAGFRTIGIVRGEEHQPLNPTLSYAVSQGMQLSYLDRTSYRTKDDLATLARLRAQFGEFTLIPEGGTNELAVRGCAELPAEIDTPYDVIAVAVGTGGTLAGIAEGLPPGKRALGFAVLKGASFLNEVVASYTDRTNWTINLDYHFGGYAKTTPLLLSFSDKFDVEPIYVGKMLYGVLDLAAQGYFAPGTTVVAIVTGSRFP